MSDEQRAAVIAALEGIARECGIIRGNLSAIEHRLVVLRDNCFDMLQEGDGAPLARVLFASPVTGKVGDVWGGDWFVATSYAQRYENRPGVFAYHTGVDLNRPGYKDSGANVYAIADGRIVYSGAVPGWQGLMVVTEHVLEDGSKLWARHAHLKNILGLGDVKQGQNIGEIGDYTPVNDPRGDHLHYDGSDKIDLGKHPDDWPGDNLARVKRDYLDMEKVHKERR